MKDASFSEGALKQAAALVRRSMLDSLPPPSQCAHEFSPGHREKMERLIVRERRRRNARKVLRRVAMFFLAALVSVSAWLTVDAEARSVFFSWVREVYESNIVYRFFGEEAGKELPTYRLSWLPEGYEEMIACDNDEMFSAYYQNGDDLQSGFGFEYFVVQDDRYIEMLFGGADYIRKPVNVDGIQADFYQALDPNETNCLIWINEDTGIVFRINGFLDETVILHIAESIILTE